MPKTTLLIIVIFLLGIIRVQAQDHQLVKLEAKHYCNCQKSLEKHVQKMDKEAKRQENKPKPYTPGMKLFGGNTLTFSFGECMNNNRSSKTKQQLAALEEQQKETLQKKVKAAIKKQCPNADPSNY